MNLLVFILLSVTFTLAGSLVCFYLFCRVLNAPYKQTSYELNAALSHGNQEPHI
jgi:hypothetical protein